MVKILPLPLTGSVGSMEPRRTLPGMLWKSRMFMPPKILDGLHNLAFVNAVERELLCVVLYPDVHAVCLIFAVDGEIDADLAACCNIVRAADAEDNVAGCGSYGLGSIRGDLGSGSFVTGLGSILWEAREWGCW